MCRSRRELSNEYLLAKIGVDTAENEPLEVWGKIIQYSSFFFRRDALKEQFGKEPNRVSCLAVKGALLGTRHPRKEKEAALQIVTGKPACLDGKIVMSTQSEKEPSVI